MKVDDNGITFSSGKQLKVYHGGVIGLSILYQNTGFPPDTTYVRTGHNDYIELSYLTQEERQELADYMICKWVEFKNKVTAHSA